MDTDTATDDVLSLDGDVAQPTDEIVPATEFNPEQVDEKPAEEIPAESQAPVVDPNLDKASRLAALIAPVHELSKYTKVCLYGEQGSGKTTWAMRAPKPLLIAVERGQKSLLNFADLSNSPVMEFKSIQQIEDLAELTKLGLFGQEYETYVIDTFSEVEKVALSNRVDQQFAAVRGRERYTPEGKDYQSNGEHLRRIAAAFRDVPKNVVFVCQENYKDGIYRPDLADKVYKKLGEYCDLIGRATADINDEDNPKFYLQTRRQPNIAAKTRIKKLPTYIEGSSFDLVHRANMAQIAAAKENQ